LCAIFGSLEIYLALANFVTGWYLPQPTQQHTTSTVTTNHQQRKETALIKSIWGFKISKCFLRQCNKAKGGLKMLEIIPPHCIYITSTSSIVKQATDETISIDQLSSAHHDMKWN
jgi:hypothetical protein